jgi:Ca2+-transporting ATPase
MSKGLSTVTAQEKLRHYGPNELFHTPEQSFHSVVKEVVTEPMIFLLICCSILYFTIGNKMEALVLFSMIGMIVFTSVLQRTRSEKALEKLRELSSPRALVLRDGEPRRIPGREVVPHDVCIVCEGDRVPADGKLIQANNLSINESILTGESLPIEKEIHGEANLLYAGSMVISGKGLLFITHTGEQTKFGQIGKQLKSIRKIKTPLQSAVKRIVRVMGVVAFAVSVGLTLMIFMRKGNWVDAILSGLATSMALIPEEFPVIFTIFLALGAWRLSKINVLTRDPSVIETLGSTTVLCADKTGTITQNEMELTSISDVNQIYSVSNHLTSPNLIPILKDLFHATDHESLDPTEKGIDNVLKQLKFITLPFEKQIPFDHNQKYTLFTYKKDGIYEHFVKGAPEIILARCSLHKSEQKKIEGHLRTMTGEGLRVLSLMKATSGKVIEQIDELDFDFVCLIGLADPIRKEVPHAVAECKKAGIKVIMMTGDHSNTASAIGNQIGLNDNEILTGVEIDGLTDKELHTKLQSTEILSRVDPIHKLRIVQLLQRRKEIVAMTGDGVNDAPSLKAAHIGIAMGSKGTDVAREAASLVLLDDNFASIVGGIKMGRRISDNMEKAMSYALAVHIPIIGLAISPIFSAQFPILMLPIHIVFMELIIDPVSSVAFETEPMEHSSLQQLPQRSKKRLFNRTTLISSLLEGMLVLGCILFIFLFQDANQPIDTIRATCFFTLVTCNILLALSKLSKSESIFKIIRYHNPMAKLILAGSFLLVILCLYNPTLQEFLHFKAPENVYLAYSVLSSIILLILLEIIKKWKQIRHSKVRYPVKSFLKKKR